MGTNYPETMYNPSSKELLETSYKELSARKGVGSKVIEMWYEKLRNMAIIKHNADELVNKIKEEKEEFPKLRHINTGCYYSKEGQQITIINDEEMGYTHFIDHTRMVNGTMWKHDMEIREFLKHYLKCDYRPIMIPANDIEKNKNNYVYEDISTMYKNL